MVPHTISTRPAGAAARRAPVLALAERSAPYVPAALLGVLLLALAFDDGGYFPSAIGWAGTVACLGFAGLAIAPATRRRLTPAGAIALGTLVALAVWTGLSARWSPLPDAALVDLRRDVLYAGLFGFALLAAGDRRAARATVRLVMAVVVIVAGAGVLSRLQPDLLGMTRGASVVFDERLSFPLGYWNAFGALAAMGAVLACGLAADVGARTSARAAAAAAGPLLVVAAYLSLSRGALPALAAGLLVLVVLSPRRWSVAVSALVIAGAAALAVVRLQAHPQLLDGTRAPGPDADRLTVELVLLLAGAAIAQALLSSLGTRARLPRRAVAAVLALSAVIGGGLVVQGGVGAWAAQRYAEFRAPADLDAAGGPTRLLTTGGLRGEAYAIALDGFRAQPLRGEGAGSFEHRWRRSRTIALPMRDAHSLVLGTMTELGAVGLLALVAFLACVGRAALRCRRPGGGALRRTTAAAVSGAVAAWFVHACLDWDWEMPALTGCALVLCATLFARRGDPLQIRHARDGRAGAT